VEGEVNASAAVDNPAGFGSVRSNSLFRRPYRIVDYLLLAGLV